MLASRLTSGSRRDRGLRLGVYVTHGKADASTPGAAENLFNSNARDHSASNMLNTLMLSAGF